MKILTWEHYVNRVEWLAEKAPTLPFKPDVLIGVARGGCIPAIHLSHKLKLPLEILRWSFRDGTVPSHEDIVRLRELVFGKNIVIIEDIVDSGVTLRSIDSYIMDVVGEVVVFALDHNLEAVQPYDVIAPVTFHRSKDDSWRVYPWEA